MPRRAKGILVLFAGILLVVIGLAGFAIPFLPGWLLIILGLIFLSLYFPGLRARIDSFTERWPKMHQAVHTVRTWVDQKIGGV